MTCPSFRALCVLFIYLHMISAADRGIFRIDCSTAAEACNNACFYMNCANPQPNGHVFRDNGNDPLPRPKRQRNEARSGAEISNGTPCRRLPFSQKFYDTYDGWADLNGDEELQTDEFPMAAFKQDGFTPHAWPPRNTLRCIRGTHNGDAGRQYRDFRAGEGPWGNKAGVMDPSRVNERLGQGDLREDDHFQVAFQNLNALTPYCNAPPALDCTNDGREWHMTELRGTGNHPYGKGLIHWPYSTATDNNYVLTDVVTQRTNNPLQAFKVQVRRGPPNGRTFYAETQVWNQVQRRWIRSAQVNFQLDEIGQSFRVPGNVVGVPLPVWIEPWDMSYCGNMWINYGAAADGNRYFRFQTSSQGMSRQYQPGGDYCMWQTMRDGNNNVLPGTRVWECVFPGW